MKRIISFVLALCLAASYMYVGLLYVPVSAVTDSASGYTYEVVEEAKKTARITGYSGSETDLIIPVTINGYKIVEIGYGVCQNNEELRSVIIPEGIVEIGPYAFSDCIRLNDITIPSTLKRCGYNAFGVNGARYDSGRVNISDLTSWCNIDFDDTYIGRILTKKDLYIDGEKITDLVIPKGITEIKNYAFYCANIKSVYIPSSVTVIGDLAFTSAEIEKVYIDNINDFVNIKFGKINHRAFEGGAWDLFAGGEKVTELIIPDGITSIPVGLFNGCKSIESVYIPGTVRYFETGFAYCDNLGKVIIADGVEEVCSPFYYSGTSQTEFIISIPESVSYITDFDVRTYDVIIECIENSYAHQKIPELSSLYRCNYTIHTFDSQCDNLCNQCSYERAYTFSHIYDADCDESCNECGELRSAPEHTYDNICDESCNICGTTRQVTHSYDNICDETCNDCGKIRVVEHEYSTSDDLSCNLCYKSLTPQAPELKSRDATSITLVTISGCEYSLDGKNWQSSPIFADLTPDKSYTFYQRVKETSTSKQSSKSRPLKTKTLKGYTITLSYNDGSGSQKTKIKTEGVDLALGTVSKSGYKFLGWSKTPYGETLVTLCTNDAKATYYAKWAHKCASCSGQGYTVEQDYTSSTCSRCYGRGTITITDESNLRCLSCGSTNIRNEYIPGATSSGGYGEKRYCGSCGSTNVGKGYRETIDCTNCNGYGYIYGYVNNHITCYDCSGKGTKKAPQPKAPKPVIKKMGNDYVELKSVSGVEYSLDGVKWKTSPKFTGLTKGKTYRFYQRYKSNSINIAGTKSEALSVKVHKHTYTNACDKKCNICDETRSITHSYKTTKTQATLSRNGKIVKKCAVCGYTKTTTVYYPKSIKLSTTEYTYNAKTKKPTVTVKDSKGNTLKKDVDYTVSYESGRKYPGKYTVKITFKGNYSGTKRLYFTIAPRVTSKITATQTTSTITLKWNKVTGADGYRVYKYNTKTKKYEKLKDVTGTTLKIAKLKSGTVYKFKVKAYTKDGDTIWGAMSSAFETTTKCATPQIYYIDTTKGAVSLAWDDISGESGYQVYYSTKKDSGYEKLLSCSTDNVDIYRDEFTSGKTYYFKVRAYKETANGTVYSSWSSIKRIKVD